MTAAGDGDGDGGDDGGVELVAAGAVRTTGCGVAVEGNNRGRSCMSSNIGLLNHICSSHLRFGGVPPLCRGGCAGGTTTGNAGPAGANRSGAITGR